MKKFLYLVLAGSLMIACTDYDSQFDQLDQEIAELAAANKALEAQLAAMAALNAQVAQGTAAQLAGFQAQVGQITTALTSIVNGLGDLGTANQGIGALVQALTAQVQAITAQIAVITTNLDALSGDSDALTTLVNSIAAAIADVQDQLCELTKDVLDTTDCSTVVAEPTDNGDGALNLIVSVPTGTTALRLSGPWWGWNPAGGPVGVNNGNGTFTFTLNPAPTENMEYLYTLDGVSYENLIDNAANAECTSRVDGGLINTDYANYANRIWKVGTGDQAETYDSCSINTVVTN